jgi:cell division protein FtsI/penicillin-binding protein 2
MALALFLFQTATPSPASTPEKLPAWLTLIYVSGLGLIVLLLLLSLVRTWLRRTPAALTAPANLPKDIRKRLGATTTNRGLRAWRWLFALAAIGVFGFHVYWARFAPERNEKFQELSYKDLRNRRLSESTLRGWIYDRKGRPLAYYKKDSNGDIVRQYPMDSQLAHIFGSDRGDPGLERALFGTESGAVPEVWQILKGQTVEQKGNKDVTITIDRDLQQAVVDQLKGKHGAVVILNPQTGDILAMYSEPSYSLKAVEDEATWIKLNANERDRPLVSRATSAYYIPGSTFKSVVMTSAFLNNLQDSIFPDSGGGYIAEPGAKPILDDNGSCEACGNLAIDMAFEASSNQYFAQMAVKLGPERLGNTARLLGIGTYDDPKDLLRGKKKVEIFNASTDAIKRAMAPREATILTNPKMRRYDLALEGFGQGYAGQMTPLQMALNVAAIGNVEGKLMKPKIELDQKPESYDQVMPTQIGSQLRQIMGLVTGGPHGTARGVFGPVHAAGVITGGKTGTAQKIIPVYDPKTGETKKRLKVEKDAKGNIIRQYEETILDEEHPRIDGWFLCLAPLEKTQLAMAVIIEGGGYGSRSAAPVAAALVLKAKDLGYFGGGGNQQSGGPNQPAKPKPRPRNR